MICRAAEGRGLPVGEVPRGLVNLWLTKSSEHQVIATEPEQAGSRTRGRPVSRPGGLFLRKGRSLSAGREALRDGLKLGPLRPAGTEYRYGVPKAME